MKGRDRSTKEGRFWARHYTIPTVVLICGIAALAMLLWIGRISHRHRTNFLHVDAVMDMQIRMTIFHLRLEEGITDPAKENWPNTLNQLDDALQLSRALLHGGHSEHGAHLPPLEDPRFRQQAEAIAAGLMRIRDIVLQRYEHPELGWTGSPVEREFNAVFDDFLSKARALEVLAETSLDNKIVETRQVLFILVLTWTATVLALSAGIYNRELRREGAERGLERAYGEMEQKVENRTSELSSANRQLLEEIAERRHTQQELERSRQELRRLTEHLQAAREEERTWVAREIHDQLGQTLTSLCMELAWIERKLSKKGVLSDPALIDTIHSMSSTIDGAIGLIREISSELRPGVLDRIGLMAAMEWQAERFSEKAGIECRLTLPPGEFQLDAGRSTALFRIFQEILTNVARHARATEVRISLANDSGRLVLEVNDNGRGILGSDISDSRAFGILGMRERTAALGGDFHIEGAPGKGTRVVVRIPLDSGSGSGEKSDAEGVFGG
ncbi:MAG: sensor histidine kinase [Deltaproteobacteria bacterium]|nr:sensor histidine kinase [Deltaproteobacteria bacterium]